MTYKLSPELRYISSPIVLIMPSGVRRDYSCGTAVCEDVFDERYKIMEVRAVGDEIVIELGIQEIFGTNWTGEEQTFF